MEDTPLDTPKMPEHFYKEKHLYTRVVEAQNPPPTKACISVKGTTDVKLCVAFCIDLLYNKQYPFIKLITGHSHADKAVFIAENLKRKVKNLHQLSSLETVNLNEKYVPKVPSEEKFEFTLSKKVNNLVIKLMRAQPGSIADYGYQTPLQINLVSSKDPRDYIKEVLEEINEENKLYVRENGKPREDITLDDYNKARLSSVYDYEDNYKHSAHDMNKQKGNYKGNDRDNYKSKGGFGEKPSYYNKDFDKKGYHKGADDLKESSYKKDGKKDYNKVSYQADHGEYSNYPKNYSKDYKGETKQKYDEPYNKSYKPPSDDNVDGKNTYSVGYYRNNYHYNYYDRDDDYSAHYHSMYHKTPYFEKNQMNKGYNAKPINDKSTTSSGYKNEDYKNEKNDFYKGSKDNDYEKKDLSKHAEEYYNGSKDNKFKKDAYKDVRDSTYYQDKVYMKKDNLVNKKHQVERDKEDYYKKDDYYNGKQASNLENKNCYEEKDYNKYDEAYYGCKKDHTEDYYDKKDTDTFKKYGDQAYDDYYHKKPEYGVGNIKRGY